MATSFSRFGGEMELPEALARMRAQAAIVRAVLDELERSAALSARSSDTARFLGLGDQLAEELVRLGHLLLDSAATMAGRR